MQSTSVVLLSEGIDEPLRVGWRPQGYLEVVSVLLENPCPVESEVLKLGFDQ